MWYYVSAILDRPVNIGALKELSTLTGRTAMFLKKAWEGDTPVLVIGIGNRDEFESSVQTLRKFTEWADNKGIGMTLCDTEFDPDGSIEAKQFGQDREFIFNRLQTSYEIMTEGVDIAAREEEEEEAKREPPGRE